MSATATSPSATPGTSTTRCSPSASRSPSPAPDEGALDTERGIRRGGPALSDPDRVFSSSIARLYEMYLVPLIFAPYAADLASRVAQRSPARVLEVAAGTGVVTRALVSTLPERAAIVATDL